MYMHVINFMYVCMFICMHVCMYVCGHGLGVGSMENRKRV